MGHVRPAPIQLADLAAVMRPDWDRAELEGTIAAARSSGWSWPKLFSETARLLVQEESSPRDLAAAARNPLERHGHDPGAYERGLAATREAMAARSGS